jgi:hypothetical protein
LVWIGHVFAFSTIRLDYLCNFVTAPFNAPFLRPAPSQRKIKLTKFCLLTDIKQLVQKYSISAAQVKTILLFRSSFSAAQTGQDDSSARDARQSIWSTQGGTDVGCHLFY